MVTVENKDCLELLKTIETNTVDLILIDPHYLISRDSGFKKTSNIKEEYKKKYGNYSIDFGAWDHRELNWCDILNESYRVLKSNGTLLCFYDIWKFGDLKGKAEQVGFKQPRIGCWNKTNPVPINSKLNYLTNAKEYFVTFVKCSKPVFHSQYDTGDYYVPQDEPSDTYYYTIVHGRERKAHPTQKPLLLISELVKKHSVEDALVLDFFAGTGTTGVACKNLGRNCILGEINPAYVDIIKQRLS